MRKMFARAPKLYNDLILYCSPTGAAHALSAGQHCPLAEAQQRKH